MMNLDLDAKALNRMHDAEIDIIDPTCQDCRGLKVTDRTPSRMFKDRDICSCNEAPGC